VKQFLVKAKLIMSVSTVGRARPEAWREIYTELNIKGLRVKG